jgi:hypothetical protein
MKDPGRNLSFLRLYKGILDGYLSSHLFLFLLCYECVYLLFCREFLVDGLTIMKNRGYDSAGLATMSGDGGPMVRSDPTC